MSRHETTRVVRTNGTPMTDAEHRRGRAPSARAAAHGVAHRRGLHDQVFGVGGLELLPALGPDFVD